MKVFACKGNFQHEGTHCVLLFTPWTQLTTIIYNIFLKHKIDSNNLHILSSKFYSSTRTTIGKKSNNLLLISFISFMSSYFTFEY